MASIQVFTGELAGRQHTLTTSRIVARVFGKQHKHVLRDIEKLDCSVEFRRSNFGPSSYLNTQNKSQPEYQMTRDGFMFLVMGFTGAEAAARKQAFIATFNDMEERLKPAPATPLEEQISRMGDQMLVVGAGVGHLMQATRALLAQQNTTAKYIALLELNQVGKRPVTPEIVREVFTLKAQGLGTRDIARLLRIPYSAVQSVVKERYPGLSERTAPEKSLDDILDQLVERGMARLRPAGVEG
jgi:Rha family phage regulatory protein